MWDIDYAQSHKKKVIDVVSESYPHMEQGVMRDFKNIMTERRYWKDERWNESKHIYKFETGSTIQFQSYDKLGKAHGPRRDVLHLNEANYLPWDVVDQLITRTRDVVWCEYNPSSEYWMHTEVLGKREDVESLKLVYLDNEGLTESELKEIESHKNNPRWWRVYGLGELGEIEGRIYTGWQIIQEIPHEARLEGYGLDFGYDPDPAAIVAVYWYNGGYIFDEILYAREVDNMTLAKMFKNFPPGLVAADSAEPKSIKEISSFGVNIIGAEKGPESVRYGVKTLQGQRISVTEKSIHLIKEYRNFFQAIDRATNIPIMGKYEGERHALDAARYKLCSLIPIVRRKEMIAAMPRFPDQPRHNVV
jgi:phage terminase large subunit